MHLQELFEAISQDYLNNPDDKDRRMNREAWVNNNREREWREKQGTGAIVKPNPEDPKKLFSNQPKKDARTSNGYKGLQRALKNSGQKYDQSALKPDDSFNRFNDPTFTRSFNQMPK